MADIEELKRLLAKTEGIKSGSEEHASLLAEQAQNQNPLNDFVAPEVSPADTSSDAYLSGVGELYKQSQPTISGGDENKQSELTERINMFLFEEDLLDDAKVDKYLARVANETGVERSDVKKVVESVLGILEEVKTDKSVVEGEAFGAHIVRRRGLLRRRFWGGNTIDFR